MQTRGRQDLPQAALGWEKREEVGIEELGSVTRCSGVGIMIERLSLCKVH